MARSPAAPQLLSSCQLLLLLLLLWLVPGVHSIRLYISRAEAMAMLGGNETRLYFHTCDQSSLRSSCVFAIDNSYNQEPTQCALTEAQDTPWWLAVLETPAYITRVTVLNMDNTYRSFQDALTSMVVMAGDEVCFRYDSEELFVRRTFPCDALADQITITSRRENSVMAICDVEVFGMPLEFPTAWGANVYLRPASCQMSSVDGSGYCENAFDGDANPDHKKKPCAVTGPEKVLPWYEAILENPAIVSEVRLFSRSDCCGDSLAAIRITINERLCTEYNGPAYKSAAFKCKYFGDKVRISGMVEAPMSICELQVMGHKAKLDEPEKFRGLGCYKDKMKDHDLPQLVSSMKMSYKKCYTMCKRLGLKNFALQNGVHCWCGSSFGKHGSVDNSTCSTQCDGSGETCGGPLLNSVFEIL